MEQRIAILGTGTMGRALANGLIQADVVAADRVRGTVKDEREAADVRPLVPFPVGTDNVAAARDADVVFLCTKPRHAPTVVANLSAAGALDHDPLVISIAAGVATATLEQASGRTLRVVRAMPNTPCLVGEGMVVIARGAHAGAADLDRAADFFAPLGRVRPLDEEHMNAVTGLSGAGPAFIYVIIEALAEGGVMTGLPRKVATELAAQTVKGAARMVLDTGRHPAALKDDVTTPAGCTISALLSMEDGRLRSVLARGVQEAARAAAGLGRQEA